MGDLLRITPRANAATSHVRASTNESEAGAASPTPDSAQADAAHRRLIASGAGAAGALLGTALGWKYGHPTRLGAAALVGGVAAIAAWMFAPSSGETPAPTPGPAPSPTPHPTPSTGPSPSPSPTTEPLPTTPPPPSHTEGRTVRVGQLNAHNLFDTVDGSSQDTVLTPAQLQTKLHKLALAIRDSMGAPDAITMEEVENLPLLQQLADQPELRALGYRAVLLDGSDPRGINVGVLYRGDRLQLVDSQQLDPTVLSPTGRHVHLFTRPPLLVRLAPAGTTDAATGAGMVTVVANHFTSQLQGESGARKRLQQATYLAGVVDARRAAQPAETLVVAGDFNEDPSGPAYHALAERGDGTRRLANVADQLPAADRYSYGTGARRMLLDQILLAPDAAAGAHVTIPHINTGAPASAADDPTRPEGVSDHDPVIADIPVAG